MSQSLNSLKDRNVEIYRGKRSFTEDAHKNNGTRNYRRKDENTGDDRNRSNDDSISNDIDDIND